MLDFDKQYIPLDNWINDFIDWLVAGYRWFFQGIKWPVEFTLTGIEHGLVAIHPLIVIAFFTLVAWRLSGVKLSIFTAVTLVFIGLLGLWQATMITLAMVLCAVVFCTVVGIPLGILAGRSNRFDSALRPVLDAMQTTPAFVYLVPIVMLFSIGNVAGVLATIVFCPAADYQADQPGHPPGTPGTGGSGPCLRRHQLAGAAQGADSACPAHHYGGA
jgi:glycine betaine/proline transport system permease protein